jgi:hypothetical protein
MAPRWQKRRTPPDGGVGARWLLGSSHIVPVAGLALAPWRRVTRLPGASQGQNPLRLSGYSCFTTI